MNTDNTLRNDCAALAALLDRMSPAPVRPAGYPERLDAAQPGDVVLLADCSGPIVRRRLVEVEAVDDAGLLVEGTRYGRHGFGLDAFDDGRLSEQIVQPVDSWSMPGWSGSMSLEL